jgi:SAM-dependent methyltransferase
MELLVRCPAHPNDGHLEQVGPEIGGGTRRRLARGENCLRCRHCDRVYPVFGAVPDLTGDTLANDSFLDAEARQWDEQAACYDERRQHDARYMAGVDAAVEVLDAQPGDLVLDAGCGTGLTVRAYLRPGLRVVGLDLSLRSLRHLWQMVAGPELELVRGQLGNLPFGDATFDRVLCANVLQQLPDADYRRRCVAELARVARPGGRVVVTAHNYSVPRRLAGWRKQGPAGGYSGRVQYVYRSDPTEFTDLLSRAMRLERLAGAGFPLPYRFKCSPLSRAAERLLRRWRAATPFADMLVGVGQPRA